MKPSPPAREPSASPTRTRMAAGERQAQIRRIAARLFQHRGVRGVGIDDIGVAAGISGPAIYRHFKGKDDLLLAVVDEFLDALLSANRYRGDLPPGTELGGPKLERLVTDAVLVGLDHTGALAATIRNLWCLDTERLSRLEPLATKLRDLWVPAFKDGNPEFQPEDTRVYVRAIAGLLIGAERPSTYLKAGRATAILDAAALRVATTPLLHAPDTVQENAEEGRWVRGSRREQILETAVQLFRERGYGGVTMADLADRLDMHPSATYRHFENKEDILATAVARAGEQIVAGMGTALSQASSGEDALERLVSSYVDACVDNRDLIAVTLTEAYHLPESARAERRQRTDLVDAEWIHCLAETRPDLTPAEALMLSRGVQGLTVEVVRSNTIMRRPHIRTELNRLALATLNACPQ